MKNILAKLLFFLLKPLGVWCQCGGIYGKVKNMGSFDIKYCKSCGKSYRIKK